MLAYTDVSTPDKNESGCAMFAHRLLIYIYIYIHIIAFGYFSFKETQL